MKWFSKKRLHHTIALAMLSMPICTVQAFADEGEPLQIEQVITGDITKDTEYEAYYTDGLYALPAYTTIAGINVEGNTNIKVQAEKNSGKNKLFIDAIGNGVVANGHGAKVNISNNNNGTEIRINEDNGRGYAALLASNGTINVNMKDVDTNISGGANKLLIKGNVVVSTKAVNKDDSCHESTINLSFANSDMSNSQWTGVAYNGFADEGYTPEGAENAYTGAINLRLKNGTWNNEIYGNVSKIGKNDISFTGSHIATLSSDYKENTFKSAIIFQKDTNPLTIDTLDGYVTLVYEHTGDGSTPDKYAAGDTHIRSAAKSGANNSQVRISTDSNGIDTNDEILVASVLNSLAGKLYYDGYVIGERNLDALVTIHEGLTAAGKIGTIKSQNAVVFDEKTGQGRQEALYQDAQTVFDFKIPILSNNDIGYIKAGVLRADGTFRFDGDTTITTENSKVVEPGPWPLNDYYAVIDSSHLKPINIDLQGHKLKLNSRSQGITTALYSTEKIEINNCGGLELFAESYTGAPASAIGPNGGGEIIIHNAKDGDTVDQLWEKAVKIRAQSSDFSQATGITSRNGGSEGCSHTVIDGLVDILVDAGVEGGEYKMDGDGNTSIVGGTKIRDYGSNMGINIVASTIDIGGGKIICQNGAFGALNAYGEFVSDNIGTINFNVVKDADGNAIGGGKMPVMIEGNFSTNGGMGTKGRINVGLTTPDSCWKGDYLFHGGYGVTIGEYGLTNLFMDNGAKWEGSALGRVEADMQGGAIWNGASTNLNSTLNIRDAAVWTPTENKAHTLRKLNGAADGNLGGIVVKNGAALTVDNYSGNTNVFYEHADATPTVFNGGDITIKNAAEGSTINLITGNNGIDTDNEAAVNNTLNALANKLYYTAYTTGERNLDGYVKIAEGLTSSSVIKYFGNIKFDEASGQGSLAYSYNNLMSDQLKKEAGKDKIEITENTAVIVTDKDSSGSIIAAKGSNEATNIEAQGKTLVLDAKSKDGSAKAVTVYASGANGVVNVAAKNVAINASGAEGSAAIAAKEGGIVKVEAAATEVKGNITNEGGKVDLTKAGDTNITGNITNEAGKMEIGGEGKQTVITGNIVNKSTDSADLTIVLDGKNSVINGLIDPVNLTLNNEARWNNVGSEFASEIGTLTSNKGVINQKSNKDISIDKLSGDVLVNYDSTYTDGKLTIDASEGKVILNGVDASKDNQITINADNEAVLHSGLEDKMTPLLALANKLNYTGEKEADGTVKNLKAIASINEGLTKSPISATINLIGDGTNTVTMADITDIKEGAYETTVMRGARAAMNSGIMAWRAENNDLMKRMGDLRLSSTETGAWGRFYRGRNTSDKDGAKHHINYTTVQVGYDWQSNKNWKLGTAISYMDGRSSYDLGGNGENKEYNIGFYGTYTDESGQYVDLIAKVGRLNNDYTIYSDRYKVDGDYGATGFSLSAEYGKKFKQKNGFYFEPNVELNYAHLCGADYTAKALDPYGIYRNMKVSQSSFNSLIGRVGIGFGYETNQSTIFAKLSLNHEFCGSMTSSFSAENMKSVDQRFRDTWLALQLGGTVKLSDRCNFYGTLEKSFGGDVKTDYRVDAGFRFEF